MSFTADSRYRFQLGCDFTVLCVLDRSKSTSEKLCKFFLVLLQNVFLLGLQDHDIYIIWFSSQFFVNISKKEKGCIVIEWDINVLLKRTLNKCFNIQSRMQMKLAATHFDIFLSFCSSVKWP